MSPVKSWPVLLCAFFVCGCSLQQHTERAERSWLSANSSSAALHRVSLTPQDIPADDSFLTATGAATYLLGNIESADINELSGIAVSYTHLTLPTKA